MAQKGDLRVWHIPQIIGVYDVVRDSADRTGVGIHTRVLHWPFY